MEGIIIIPILEKRKMTFRKRFSMFISQGHMAFREGREGGRAEGEREERRKG